MKRRYVACTVFAAVSVIVFAAADVRADFESGWQAYQRGDFGDALKEWRPLAESGDRRAQFNLGAIVGANRAWIRRSVPRGKLRATAVNLRVVH